MSQTESDAMREAGVLLDAIVAGMREAAPSRDGAAVDIGDGTLARLHAGIPALSGERLLDDAALLDAARRIAGSIAAADAARGAVARRAAEGLARLSALIADDAISAIALAGSWDELAGLAPRLGLDAEPLIALADWASRPALRAAAERLRAMIEGAPWSRGRCPACGALPLLGELRPGAGEDARVLRCGRCATAWRHPRLGCPDCGERDHRQLRTLGLEGELEHRRIDACDRCGFYLKVIAVLDPPGADALLALDVETAALDFLAAERGLRRGERAE